MAIDLLEEIKLDEQNKKKIKLFKYLCAVVLIITCAAIIFVFFNKKKELALQKESVAISDIIVSEKIVDENTLNKFLPKENKSAFVLHLQQINMKLNKNNSRENRQRLSDFIDSNFENYFIEYAKILWMSKILDLKKNLISNDEKEKFIFYSNSFNNDKKIFFSRSKVFTALFFILQNDSTRAKSILLDLIGNVTVPKFLKEDVKNILSTID